MRTNRLRRSVARPLVSFVVVAVVAVAGLQSPSSAAVTPTFSAYASAGWWVGTPIYDSVNLNNGVNPTGTLTFRLYGINDPDCSGAPIFITQKAVAGNGYYSSASYTPNEAGTYHWTVSYSGDANNFAIPPTACTDPNQTTMVAKRNINLNGAASAPSSAGSITNTATLAMGVGPNGPTGTITFTLFGPNNMTCTGASIFTSTKRVSGNGTYTSDAFTPSAAGKYQWKVNYSGDANNVANFTICSDTANHVTVGARTTTTGGLSVSAGPTSVRPASQLSVTWSNLASPSTNDWVGFYAVGASGWSLLSWSYTTGAASGSVALNVPAGTPPGNYEVRLRTAKSNVVTVF